jgi:hypothetical protein
MGDWLGTGNVASHLRTFRGFQEARSFAKSLKLSSKSDWETYTKGHFKKLPQLPEDIPAGPAEKYKKSGWISWSDWLGSGASPKKKRKKS